MTLPGACLPGLDAVTVGASHNALVPRDLGLDRRDGFQCRDVRRLTLHVVDVERGGMLAVAAVDTPVGDLVIRDPRLDSPRTGVLDRVHLLSVARLRQPLLSPRPPLFSRWLRAFRARFLATPIRAVLRLTLRLKSLAALSAEPLLSSDIRPRRHNPMVPAEDRNPCKPGIFTATYEAVES